MSLEIGDLVELNQDAYVDKVTYVRGCRGVVTKKAKEVNLWQYKVRLYSWSKAYLLKDPTGDEVWFKDYQLRKLNPEPARVTSDLLVVRGTAFDEAIVNLKNLMTVSGISTSDLQDLISNEIDRLESCTVGRPTPILKDDPLLTIKP